MKKFTTPSQARSATELLKALGNRHRLEILCLLVEGERSVGQLQARLDLPQPALSQHLARLRSDRLVKTRRESQTIRYSLADDRARKIVETLHRIYCGDSPAEPSVPVSSCGEGSDDESPFVGAA